MNGENINSDDLLPLRFEKIALADGRYMIFYEFGESFSNSSEEIGVKPEPKPQPEAVEEKNV